MSFEVLQPGQQSLRESIISSVGARVVRSRRGTTLQALKDISLVVSEGERIGVIGHNGAGKTTLLKVCAGIYEPTEGSADIVGRVASMTDYFMGMDPSLSGYDNIVRRGIFMGLSKRESHALIPGVEEFSELGDYLRLPMRTYSSGMFLRLAFSIATTVVPDILIMDELMGAGDINFSHKARKRTVELIDRSKILIFASHDTDLLSRICRTGLVLYKGEVIYYGAIQEAVEFYKAASAEGGNGAPADRAL